MNDLAAESTEPTPAVREEGRAAAAMLREFHDTFGGPGTKTDELWLRGTLHREESDELIAALQEWVGQLGKRKIERGDTFPPTHDPIRKAVARELADVVYVAYGSALIAGIDLDAAIAEVHRANMSKLGEDGKPILREDGKVLKGPNFRKPDLTAAIAPGREPASTRVREEGARPPTCPSCGSAWAIIHASIPTSKED